MKTQLLNELIIKAVEGRKVIAQGFEEKSYELNQYVIVEAGEEHFEYFRANIPTRESNDNTLLSAQLFPKEKLVEYRLEFEAVEVAEISKYVKAKYDTRFIKHGLADKIMEKVQRLMFPNKTVDQLIFELTGVEMD